MADPSLSMPESSRRAPSWLAVVGYFVVFFGAMALAGVLFTLGGVTLVLIPGSLPIGVKVGYVVFGIVGSVTIALLAANGAFRVAHGRREQAGPAGRPPSMLGWTAGVLGTVVASVLSAVLGAVILRWLGQ